MINHGTFKKKLLWFLKAHWFSWNIFSVPSVQLRFSEESMEHPTGSGSTPPLPFLCDWMWNKTPWICNCQKKGKAVHWICSGSDNYSAADYSCWCVSRMFICGSFSKGRFFFVTIQYKNSSSVTSHTACTLLNLTVISFFLTDAFNIISLDSITNYYRLVQSTSKWPVKSLTAFHSNKRKLIGVCCGIWHPKTSIVAGLFSINSSAMWTSWRQK